MKAKVIQKGLEYIAAVEFADGTIRTADFTTFEEENAARYAHFAVWKNPQVRSVEDFTFPPRDNNYVDFLEGIHYQLHQCL